MKLLRRLVHLGHDVTHDKLDTVQIKLINKIAISTLLLIGVYSVYNVSIGQNNIFILSDLSYVLIAFLILYFNAQKAYKKAKVTVTLGFGVAITLTTVLIGAQNSSEFLLLISGIGIVMFFNRERLLKRIFISFIMICLVGLKVLFIQYPKGIMNVDFPYLYSIINSLWVFLVIILVVDEIIRNRTLYLDLLVSKNEDISNLNASLQELNHDRNRLLGNITHELKTPLTLISGPIRNILSEQQIDRSTQQELAVVQRNIVQLKQLVNQILDLSKEELAEIGVHVTEFSLDDLLKCLVKDFTPLANYQRIRFHSPINFNPDLKLITDKEKLFITLRNILSNAFKYTPSEGQVFMDYLVQDNQIQITIRDTGRGIVPKDLPHIFDRYYQSRYTDHTVEGGTGIGLAICKEYIQLLQGSIEVQSEPNKGSAFIISLPIKIGTPTLHIKNESDFCEYVEQPHLTDNNINSDNHILIVEDNLDMCNYLKVVLNNYKITFVHNGKEALKRLKEVQPDIILTDLMMPQMDGLELIKSLKNDEKLRSIPVMMLTARDKVTDRLEALSIGIDDYLIKPFDEKEIQLRVQNMLNRLKERNEYQNHRHLETENTAKSESSAVSEPDVLNLTGADLDWLKEVEKIIYKNIKNTSFNINSLGFEMAISTSQLYRKIKIITGLTPKQYVNQVRYEYARSLLEQKKVLTIKEVAFEIGLKDEKNFARNFKKRFGKYPSMYLE